MNSRYGLLFALAVEGGLLLLPAAPAAATSLTAAQVLDTFNLVTVGDASTYSDIEGSAVIGGNLNGSGTFFNNRVPTDPVVYLYGANNATSENIDSGGKVNYGSNSGSFNLNGGATATKGGWPNTASTYTAPLTAMSQQLSTTTANSSYSYHEGKLTFNAAPDASGNAIFSISAATLQNDLTNGSLAIKQNKATGIIINVSGNFTDPSSFNFNSSALQDVLFNFYNATSVSVGGWETSILAPNASVGVANGALEGSVFAASFTGGGEIHNVVYTGTLPTAKKVPEPGALLLLGTALAGLGISRRWIRRAARATPGSP